ncbi:MAG: molybdate ABC transporter substrate-binding protein [Rhodobacteraceae bacterium]|nr:molybdate ABC transporter substrate-binding protein [Paracoccaceae bacterium]
MWRTILFLMVFLTGMSPAMAAEITLAVASNFAAPAKEMIQKFEQQTGHRVRLVLGSSGRMYAQITHGAPFDVFLSADRAKPAALDSRGLTLAGSRFTYAVGTIVLWSPRPGFITANGDVLKEGHFKRLALANPKLAPYGLAARETLQALGLYHSLSPKFVQGENIAQTYQFIATGNAELGFIARGQVPKDGDGSVWIIPDSLHSPLRQDAVLLKRADHNPAALAFMIFLRSEQAQKIILAHSYILPERTP